MNNASSYLITGTAGFIGYSVALGLLESGIDIIGVDNFNDYYDVNLKLARNAVLEKYKNYISVEADIADFKKVIGHNDWF